MKQALTDALQKRGYTDLTPVQEAVTADELAGADLLVSAQTGSGKTVGFGLALGDTLLGDDEGFGRAGKPLALIIAPTRELALQVKRELAWLYAEAGAVLASCVGGMDMRDERRALDRGAHIVVATPGRLRDHIMRGSIDLGDLRAVVLDEADEMLDLGFREDLEFILEASPVERRTLMFSATVPPAIAKLAKNFQRDAVRVSTVAERSQHADIEYLAMNVAARDAENAIINVLRYYESPNALVFANTRAMVNRITTRLGNRGFSVVSLSGELSQQERTHALQAMRDGRARVCVATDVAARGIDLPNLDLVVHAELPTNHETLLHRSGRTGRAGRKGVSVLIIPPVARKKAERILKFAKVTAAWGEAPSAEAVSARDEERMMADPVWLEPVSEDEAAGVEKLAGLYDAQQLAAAYLRLYRTRQSAPEELSGASSEPPKPREPFGPSVWFSVSGGRAAGAEPRRLLPMMCKAGGLTKDDIGAIRIQQDESFVEIKASSVPGFLKALDGRMEIETGSVVAQLDTAPEFSAQRPPDKPRAPRAEPRKAYSPDAAPVAAAKEEAPVVSSEPAPRAYKPKPADGEARKPYKKPEGKPYKKHEGAPYKKRDEGSAPYKKREEGKRPNKAKAAGDKPYKPREGGAKPYKDRADKPFGKPGDAPRKPKPRPVEAPVDWSDPSVSRRRKPGQPERPDGVVTPYKKRAPAGAKPGGAPVVGKPTSKKNKARAAAAKAGMGAPKKPGRKPE